MRFRRRRGRRKIVQWETVALGVIFIYVVFDVFGHYLSQLAHALILTGLFATTLWLASRLFNWIKLRSINLSDIDRMDPFDFEDYVAELLGQRGYRTMTTKRSADFGADVIAADRFGQKIAVQAKHSGMSRPIDLRAVQEVVAARGHYRCTRAMVITNSSFTKAAIELALDNDVILWDRNKLGKEIAQTQLVRALLNIIKPTPPTSEPMQDVRETSCPLCGSILEAERTE
jgi:restriction system protein